MKIFNRIFISFILFAVMVLIVFWVFYFRDVSTNTEKRIGNSILADSFVLEKEVNQYFSLRESQINVLSEMSALKQFLHERGFLKTKARGLLEKDLIDVVSNSKGIEMVRVVESKYFSAEPTILDVMRHRDKIADQGFEETLKVGRDATVKDRFEAKFDYLSFDHEPLVSEAIGQEDVAYGMTAMGGNKYLSVARVVKDRITGEITGVIIIDLSIPYLREFFYLPASSYIADFAIQEQDGLNLFDFRGGQGLSSMDVIAWPGMGSELLNSSDDYVFKRPVKNLGLSLLIQIDATKAMRAMMRTRIFMYALFIGMTIAAILISYVLSKSIATPIRKLSSEVDRIDEDAPARIHVDTGVSEISHLTSTFNRFIDDLKKYKKELQTKTHLAAIGQTTSMIAHDVRRPLASMKAVLGIIPEIKEDKRMLAKAVSEVDRSITQTNRMLNDVLEFSRDSRVLDWGAHDPQDVVLAALRDVLNEKQPCDVSVSYDLKHTNLLYVDVGRIIRVLSNIMSNAVDAMDRKGRLWIHSSDIPSDVPMMSIVIGNDGPVIPDDVRATIFDPFFTYKKKGGSGLGLAICRRIVELHGGSMRFESESSDLGNKTEFIIELPVRKGQVSVDESALIHHSEQVSFKSVGEGVTADARSDLVDTFKRLHEERGGRSYMLIVDDEPLFRLSLRSILQTLPEVKGDLTVVEADSAEKALELIGETAFDYVITDIDLGVGRMSGYDLVHQLLSSNEDIHVVIHSNKRRSELDQGIVQMDSPQFMGFLPKPMKESDMLKFLALKPYRGDGEEEITESMGKKRVLVLNDDDALRISLKLMLKSPMVEVVEAETVEDALAEMDHKSFDVILADINLGDGEPTGYDFLKVTRNSGNQVPIYVVSGLAEEEERDRASESGANDYFQLPLSDDALTQIKRHLVD